MPDIKPAKRTKVRRWQLPKEITVGPPNEKGEVVLTVPLRAPRPSASRRRYLLAVGNAISDWTMNIAGMDRHVCVRVIVTARVTPEEYARFVASDMQQMPGLDSGVHLW